MNPAEIKLEALRLALQMNPESPAALIETAKMIEAYLAA